MKSNNELEAKDLRIDDLEVDDEWQQVIVAYMETWFDVDRKFHLDINSQEGTWLNMTVFHPLREPVRIPSRHGKHIQRAHRHLHEQDPAALDILEKHLDHAIRKGDECQQIEQTARDHFLGKVVL